ncbi:MAG: rhamnogalacturonan acetylesterase [Flaviaesturariibacter sp.]|nr:rhamnogalacturonan acetylesterase [Flaviaesturariibacter sp.]
MRSNNIVQKACLAIMAMMMVLSFATPPVKKTKVWLVGDSTMCEYEPQRSPLTGWGMPFATFFDSSVVIDNRAKGGRSTRTFLAEGRWQPVADSASEGDWVLIQFGHNDEAKEEKYKDRYTPVTDYKTNLLRFIREARARKANPVLITPVSRMRFDKQGKAMETHADYTAAMIEVAQQAGVPLIDLDQKSRRLLDEYGPAYAKLLFMQLVPGEHPHYPEGQTDNTHFNEYGARKIAELVLSGIKEQGLGLAQQIARPPVKK